MGAIRKKIEVNGNSAEAFDAFRKVLSDIGKVKNADRDQMKIQGWMTFGLQSVPIKFKFQPVANDKTIVQILAWSDDIWSYAAKDSISRVLKFYGDPTKEIEEKDLLGLRPIYFAFFITGFYWLLKDLVFPTIRTHNLWDYAVVFGSVVVVYFVISRIRFSYL